MSCDYKYTNPIITINHVYKDLNHKYVFIGNYIPSSLKNILSKIESNKNITQSDTTLLKKYFTNFNINSLLSDKKSNKTFIYDFIKLDDSLEKIKQKIFIHLSQPKKDYFFLEKSLELWTEKKTNQYNILGYYYINRITGERLNIKPAIYSKIEIDPNFVDKNGTKKNKYELISNNPILFDAIDIQNINEHTIYLTNLADIVDKLKKHGITKMTEKLVNGYMRKHFPEVNLKLTKDEILKKYKSTINKINRDEEISQLINNTKIDQNQFTTCNISHVRLNVNFEKKEECVDLLKIFNYLRRHLNHNIPFVKYKDPDWDKPYSAVYDKAVKDGSIEEEKLRSWLNLKTSSGGDMKFSKGITLKIKLYEYEKKPYYGTLNIYRTSRLEIMLNYISNYNATIKDVINNMNKIENLINDINKTNFAISNDDPKKIEPPSVSFKNNFLITSENTHILYISSKANYNLTKNINTSDLYNFSKLFTPYVSYKLDVKNIQKQFTIVYKKVSNFVNMSDIYKDISEKYQLGLSEDSIVQGIMEKYEKSLKEATILYNDYKKRYGGFDKFNLMKQPGITICVIPNTNGISVSGAPDFYSLVKANQFIVSMLSIYENFDSYKKNKEFRRLILTSDEYIEKNMKENTPNELENINFNINNENRNENFNINNVNIDNKNLDINFNTNLNKNINKNININIDTNINNKKNNNNNKKVSNYYANLTEDGNIDPNIKLKCDDAIVELDTCRDLCNDSRYYLRRLQRHDLKLFKYKLPNQKYKKYSRACQQANQPIVMKTNPETNPNIDRDSFTYAIKYGTSAANQNYYICPKVWCPYCQIPISYSKVKDIKQRKTSEGICTVGKCPNGDHQVLVNVIKDYADAKKFPKGLYPGFSVDIHPDGFCLPCCFKLRQDNPKSSKYALFKKCIGEDINENKGDETVKYILSSTSYLQNGRYGLLPIDLAKLFQTRCEQGFIKENCWIRQGVEKPVFLSVIADVISDDKKISVDQIKSYLISKLTPKLFKSLNGGTLETIFKPSKNCKNANNNNNNNNKNKNKKKIECKNSYENFKHYIKSGETLNEKYLWDFLSRPDILYPEGLNIILFTEETIICPVGFDAKEFYNPDRKTIFIIKYSKNYNPIYYLKYNNGNTLIEKLFDYSNKHVENILNIIQNNCVECPGINWKQILKNNEKKLGIKYDMELEKEQTLKQTINLLPNNYKLKTLVTDYYNKCIGILLNNGLYLPVKPTSVEVNKETINFDNIKTLTYKETRDELIKLDKNSKINCKPIYKLMTENKDIIGIMTETGRIVPVKSNKVVDDKIPIKDLIYYEDANKMIYEGRKNSNKRIDMVAKMEYENETYQRLRYELSKYLKINKTNLNKIKEIIESKNDIIVKKRELKSILSQIFSKIVSCKSKNIDFAKYKPPNTRVICQNISVNSCEKYTHCVKDGTNCKLHMFPKNLINGKNNLKIYTEMIIEELIRNRMKRDEILRDKINDVINKQKLDKRDNEVLFFGKMQNDMEKITKLYDRERHLYIRDIDVFNTAEPKYYGINKEYIELNSTTNESANSEPLSVYWTKMLNPDFMGYKMRDGTLFTGFARALNYLLKNSNNKLTSVKLKNGLVNYDPPENVIENIAKKIEIDLQNKNVSDDLLLRLYKIYDPKEFKGINSREDLRSYILTKNYQGTLIDIYLLSFIFKVNVIILDRRKSKKDGGYGLHVVRQEDADKYILLYAQLMRDKIYYEVIENKGKYIFDRYSLPDRFVELMEVYEKFMAKRNENKPKTVKLKIKKKKK